MTDDPVAAGPREAPEERPVRGPRGLGAMRAAWPIWLPVLLFVALSPDPFIARPNDLDPFFYTGWAANLDDLLPLLGQSHYSVTRWPAYLPTRTLSYLVGLVDARMIVRWAFVAGIFLAARRLLRSLGSNGTTAVVASVAVVTMPMFALSLSTDYEYATLGTSALVVLLCSTWPMTRLRAVAIGALAAMAATCNPFAAITLLLPVAAAGWFGAAGSSDLAPKARLRRSFAVWLPAAGSASAVLLAALLWFRIRYGLPNIYRPTVVFTLYGPRTGRDTLSLHNLTWLRDSPWLFLPVFAIVALGAIARAQRRPLERVERVALALCAAQYLFQWYLEFVEGAFGLRLAYYWVYMLPALSLVLVLLVRRCLDAWSRGSLIILAAAWALALRRIGGSTVRLPASWSTPVALVAAAALIVVLGRRWPRAPLLLVALVLLVGQVLAPHTSDPGLAGVVDPGYDRVFGQDVAASTRRVQDVTWFLRTMDRIPDDEEIFFVTSGREAVQKAALYGAQITGNTVHRTGGGAIPWSTFEGIRLRVRPLVALVGPSSAVADMASRLRKRMPVPWHTVLRARPDRSGRLEVWVLRAPLDRVLPARWKGAELPTQSGVVSGDTLAQQPGRPGWLTYGPYVRLVRGSYVATVHYRSAAPSGAPHHPVATLLVMDDVRVAASAAMSATGGTGTVRVRFTAPARSRLWQIVVAPTTADEGLVVTDVELGLA